MKKTYYLLLFLLVAQEAATQNVGIGTTTPHNSALVDMNSNTKGILIPTMTATQRRAITNPANGLLVFQTNETPGFCYYNGQDWIIIGGTVLPSGYGNTLTLAGSGAEGGADGAGSVATFRYPSGVAVDAAGNVYIADHENHRIRKIVLLTNGTSIVTTLAGNGAAGFADGTATTASFNYPAGLAADASGNVYVADFGNNRIRKITPTGLVTTLAGSGAMGNADGTGTSASFNSPLGVAVDAAGNVYVADWFNHKIRKITSTGVVSTFAGSGLPGATDADGTAASFNQPHGVAVDPAGNVYVADRSNQKIRKIIPLANGTGTVTTLAGSGVSGSTDAQGTAASFSEPISVAADASGNVYVADNANHKVRKITPSGLVTTLAGNGTAGAADGIGAAATFNYLFGVAVDATPGFVYVADRNNHLIRRIVAW